MPSLCGTLQHNRYQNNLPYVESLKEGKPTLEDLLADPQAPTRTTDGRDPFASDADQATNYLPRYREPVEDVSKIGTWRMKTVLGEILLPAWIACRIDKRFEHFSRSDGLLRLRFSR
jgi:hypothetical protein